MSVYQKNGLRGGDSYILDIGNPRDEIPELAVMLAIDCVSSGTGG